jgi:EpsI family protein
MSLTIESEVSADPTSTPSPRPPARPRAVWALVGLALAMLLASGAVRFWQARGIDEAYRQGLVSPFPLVELPMQLGDWEGTEEKLDPQIAQATGCSDYVFRVYQNRQTGVRLNLIVLYGPSGEVILHVPTNCYPDNGYVPRSGADTRTVQVGDVSYPFHSIVYLKGEGATMERQEVFWTWRYAGHWSPDRPQQKLMDRVPGMYKVHLSRQVGESERRDIANPSESFLKELMPWLDGRLAEAGPLGPAEAARVAGR